MRRDNGGYFWTGAGIGALLGGAIGALFDNSDDFDFSMLDNQQKALELERLVGYDQR